MRKKRIAIIGAEGLAARNIIKAISKTNDAVVIQNRQSGKTKKAAAMFSKIAKKVKHIETQKPSHKREYKFHK